MLLSTLIYFCAQCTTEPLRETTTGNANKDTIHSRNCTKSQTIILFVLAMFLFICSSLTLTHFTTFLATFAVEYLHWTDQEAASLTSLYVLGLVVGRFVSIFAVKLIGVTMLFWCSILLACTGAVLFHFLNFGSIFIWVSAGVIGLSVGNMYASTLAWANEKIPLSDRLASTLILASSVGDTLAPVVQGQLFKQFGVGSFINLNTAAVSSVLGVFFAMNICILYFDTSTLDVDSEKAVLPESTNEKQPLQHNKQ